MKSLPAGLLFLSCAAHAAAADRPARIEADAPAATVAKQVCAQCHGAEGTAALDNVPNLAGQQAAYLRKQLHTFKHHDRRDREAVENMWAIAHDLSEKQIDDLARWFAGQTPATQPVEGTPDQIAAGEAVYTSGAAERGIPACASCHGARAGGKDATPRLAGQHTTYLVKQLMVFQRTNERPGARAMRSLAHELTPANIAEVAAYLQALPRTGKL